MHSLRTALLYTLSLYAAGLGIGFVVGILARITGLEHQWGTIDPNAAIRLVLIFAAAVIAFATLAKRHAGNFYRIGSMVVVLTAILSTGSAYLTAPQSARVAYNWFALFIRPLLFNAVALVLAGFIFRLRRSSSNTSLERTREG